MHLTLLVLAVCLTGCTAHDAVQNRRDRWQGLKARIRAEFDDVRHLTIDEFIEQRSGRTTIVDVREVDEFAVSHLPGALSSPAGNDLGRLLAEVQKDELVVVYCSVGWRSSIAVRRLHSLGFAAAVNLEGSIFEWANRSMPLEGRDGARGLVHPFNAEWGELVEPQHRAPLK